MMIDDIGMINKCAGNHWSGVEIMIDVRGWGVSSR